MFFIMMKDVDGRRHDTYYHKWDNAEAALLEDVADIKKNHEVIEQRSVDRMNIEAGLYEREETLIVRGVQGPIRFHYAIIDAFFRDEE